MIHSSNPSRERDLSLFKMSKLAVKCTQLPIQQVHGFFSRVFTDDLPPSSAEVNNEWSSTSALPIYLHGVDTDSFAFFF
jgi:hypothetical protein